MFFRIAITPRLSYNLALGFTNDAEYMQHQGGRNSRSILTAFILVRNLELAVRTKKMKAFTDFSACAATICFQKPQLVNLVSLSLITETLGKKLICWAKLIPYAHWQVWFQIWIYRFSSSNWPCPGGQRWRMPCATSEWAVAGVATTRRHLGAPWRNMGDYALDFDNHCASRFAWTVAEPLLMIVHQFDWIPQCFFYGSRCCQLLFGCCLLFASKPRNLEKKKGKGKGRGKGGNFGPHSGWVEATQRSATQTWLNFVIPDVSSCFSFQMFPDVFRFVFCWRDLVHFDLVQFTQLVPHPGDASPRFSKRSQHDIDQAGSLGEEPCPDCFMKVFWIA